MVELALMVEHGNKRRTSERLQEGSRKTKYLVRFKNLSLNLPELAFRRKIMKSLELKNHSREDRQQFSD